MTRDYLSFQLNSMKLMSINQNNSIGRIIKEKWGQESKLTLVFGIGVYSNLLTSAQIMRDLMESMGNLMNGLLLVKNSEK